MWETCQFNPYISISNSLPVRRRISTLTRCHAQELVTLGPLAEGKADPNNAGMHLSPEEFHTMALESASESVTSSGQGVGRDAGGSGTVLLDCRNLYETRIGHFDLVRIGALRGEDMGVIVWKVSFKVFANTYLPYVVHVLAPEGRSPSHGSSHKMLQ